MARPNKDDRTIKRCECLIVDVPAHGNRDAVRMIFFQDRSYIDYFLDDDRPEMAQAKWMISEHNTVLISKYEEDENGDNGELLWRETKASTSKAVIDWLAELALLPRRTESK